MASVSERGVESTVVVPVHLKRRPFASVTTQRAASF
jgi:hypothetical protein